MKQHFNFILLCAFLSCLVLLSCRSARHSPESGFLLNPSAPEVNLRAPDIFLTRLDTSKGPIVIEVHRDWSPHGADRFYNLIRAGYFNGAKFFRVIQGKWAQFGIAADPKVSEAWHDRTIADDPRVISNTRGTVAFAFAVPNGRTTELFINLRDNSATHDPEPFVPFGKIIQGMDVADSLNSEYGESAGGGIRGGKQGPLFEIGNAYLEKNFPRLDFIRRAMAVPDSAIFFEGAPAELKISAVSDRTIRVELAPLDEKSAVQPKNSEPILVPFSEQEKFRARELSGEKEIQAGSLRVQIRPRPLTIAVHRADGTLVQEMVFNENSVTNAVSFRTAAPVLGLGEGAEQFDRRGNNFFLVNGERYKLAEFGARVFSPFIIGTEGWAMLFASPSGGMDLRNERGEFNPGRNAKTGAADVFVIDAREPANAMSEFVRLTGAPVMPPKWALGYMQSHRTLSTEADILAEAKTFREKNLPCDAFIFLGTGFCPAGWNLGHDSFEFNTNVFIHSPAEVIRELHEENLRVVLHVVPPERKYSSLHGNIPPAPGEELDTRDIGIYWARHRELVADGVDGWWPDEGDWLDVPSRLARHRMYYEGPLSDTPNVRPWNLQRNGAPGISRYGGWIWSGDISSSWKTLASQVEVGLNSSLSISPFWGTDIGGFFPPRDREYTGELYARWFEFAAFCPLFRSHGRTWQLHLPWGWNTGKTGPVESRPAPDPSELHNAAVEPVCRKYLDLRYRLMPYNYTITRQARDTGMPLMRALWLHYPLDPEAVKLGDEFLWGRDLLVAPVTEKGATSRRVYLPAGNWFDWWNDKKISGGKWIERPVDLGTMPIYVRAGAILPLDPVRQYVSQNVSEPTTMKIFPGADGEFTFYDDDGQSLGYLNGSDAKEIWIRCRWNDAARTLTLEPGERMKKWPGGERSFSVETVGGAKPAQIKFNGERMVVRL
ncbi:MAG TPA: TIM-barrel domain-containing protein [Verrucomicrobiae bacterium]|nr:TIM-barrel domain-containing protein [Verrucomicrobiae bacterium]